MCIFAQAKGAGQKRGCLVGFFRCKINTFFWKMIDYIFQIAQNSISIKEV